MITEYYRISPKSNFCSNHSLDKDVLMNFTFNSVKISTLYNFFSNRWRSCIGVSCHQKTDTTTSVIQRAYKPLYAVKHAGKNWVYLDKDVK